MASLLFFTITIVYMLLLCTSPWPTFESSVDDHQMYIVHVEEPDDAQLTTLNPEELQSYYTSFLSSVASTTTSSNDLNTAQYPPVVHSYRHVLPGFAAKLSVNDLKVLEKKKGFIAAFHERILSLHTTHSPSFLGLNQNVGLWSRVCETIVHEQCLYQSCKSCCAKAQNPCHIHVLKGNSSLPDNPPSSSSPVFDYQSTEVSHSGSFHRLRQLSSNFSQFSNLQTPLRSRRPLTKKDGQVINEWRFLKLKEFKDGKIEAETETFDRYVRNVGLLEEVFLVKSADDEQPSAVNSCSDGENNERVVQGLKLKLGSNMVRTDNLRKRIVDQGLRKLGKTKLVDVGNSDLSDRLGHGITTNKRFKSLQGEVAIALNDLNDKLSKARNEDDLKACQEMASEMFRWNSNTKTVLAEDDEVVISSQKFPKYDSYK